MTLSPPPAPAGRSETALLAPALGRLHRWLETMRQPGGYGGPVAHWWQSRYEYAGPGLDWRYEGILAGYALLARRTDDSRWMECLATAAGDLTSGQRPDGTYRGSQFEMNPGVLGTPHESAATLGLLLALPLLSNREQALVTAKRNLDTLIGRLWDDRAGGFNDRPGVQSRVPNKLATLALALMAHAEAAGDTGYLQYARAALDDVARYQTVEGEVAGAVHQYDPGDGRGDGRFFPLYNARCIPALLRGADVLGESGYRQCARRIGDFLRRTMHPDGSWPQIVYAGGKRAEWPRWVAGTADVLLAFLALGDELPPAALRRLLGGQLPSGGFRTAEGFASQVSQAPPPAMPDFRDVTPVVGWNDKVFHLLSRLLPDGASIPATASREVREPVLVGTIAGEYLEDGTHMQIRSSEGMVLYRWPKDAPWAYARGRVLTR